MTRRRRRLIYLLGFMGVGKSTVGAVLARKLRWPFIDLDTTIEAGQGTTIRQMFEQAGEAFFREIERAALIEASKAEPAIIFSVTPQALRSCSSSGFLTAGAPTTACAPKAATPKRWPSRSCG
ncbi:MAG: hypothetical protein LAO07_17535 [Acidobacteriia bacterium]|nr:hypothetical protein [Terriglobia bacterium]